MTQVTIIGEEQRNDIEMKIVFTESLTIDKTINKEILSKPKDYSFIELISRYGEFDIMFAHRGNRNDGTLFLGHFNDGIV